MTNTPETNGKPQGFESAQSKAEEFARDKEKTGYLLDEAVEKAQRHKAALAKIWKDLQALFRMVKAWVRGGYDRAPWRSIIFAIAGIIYFVNPFDIIPDFLPTAGFLDDATVIGFVIKSIKTDIDQFLEWEAAQELTDDN